MPDIAIAFIGSTYNKYSFSALAGAIESTRETEATPLYFLSDRKLGLLADKISALVSQHERLLVCFSFATTSIVRVHSQLTAVRTGLSDAGVVFIAGGPHATGDPKGTLALGFDVVVVGEAEESFPKLVSALVAGSSMRGIKGIAYSEAGTIVTTGRAKPVDLNAFAPFSVKRGKLSPIEISRGCPHACRFCQTSFIFGGRMRHRSVENILKYIRLSKANGTRDFRFISPNALAYGSTDGKTVNLEAIESLLRSASAITGRDHLFFGSFPSEVRPEAVSSDALGLITGYTASKMLVIGAQTGSQRMLDILHREHTVEDVYAAVDLILGAGLDASVDFIFGLPGETGDDRRLSIDMIEKLARMGARIHSHTFIPLPGTPLATSEAGAVDEELARYLSRLANRGLQFGQWKKQQELAREASLFIHDKSETKD